MRFAELIVPAASHDNGNAKLDAPRTFLSPSPPHVPNVTKFHSDKRGRHTGTKNPGGAEE